MDRVYIMSRYRAATEKEQEFCREVARYFARQLTYEGKEPAAPHLFYTQFLDDAVPDEREAGLGYGLFDLRVSQEFLLVVIDGIISEGMKAEIAEASRLGIHGRIVAMGIRQIKEAMKVVV
ncbi:DUF4406 domain-containing protein [bacterium D16-50]|nr:DUF4406 domain-containing protein [bacterium D16-50]